MTRKDFFNRVANGKSDVIQVFLDTLARLNVDYCVIGGLAVNAYAEPVVSLDLVIAADNAEKVCETVAGVFKVERFPHSVNLASDQSDLRIQLRTNSRYQDFLGGATVRQVLGYDLRPRSNRCFRASSGPIRMKSAAPASGRRIWPTFFARLKPTPF